MRTKKTVTREAIAEAAIRCFESYGPQRTSMADIADEAGFSRQSVYRFFEDRSALIQYILNQRISAMAESLKPHFAKYKTIEEALVDGSILSLRSSRNDPLFVKIVTTSTDHSLELFLFRGTDDIRRVMLSYWAPILDKARSNGRIDAAMTNERIMEWVRHVHTILMLRDDQDERVQRQMLKDFFVPSIVQGDGASRGRKRAT